MVDFSSNIVPTRIAFGSCRKQWMPDSIFKHVTEYSPELWIWLGDAYYTSPKQYMEGKGADPLSIESLMNAKNKSLESPLYQEMVSALKFPVLGTYDDHDRGVNDGGGIADAFSNVGVVDRDIRQDIYLDFLDVNDQARRMRDGVYSSTVLGHGSKTVKIIILDTRYSRGDFVIPSVASFRFMGGFAVASRLLSTIMGLVRFQTETILGDTQWLWLESELNSTKNISITILVSSIQVFTSNPIVESFGHFPLARRKLVNLLMAYKPRGLLVLSGDVHLAEVLSAGPELQPIEFTSSGLTHDCSDGGIPKFVGEFIWYLFGKHRNGINPMYSNKNFGGIDIHWKENNDSDCSFERINVTIFDDTGQPVYSVIRSTCSMDDILPQRISSFSAGPWYFETAWQQCILFGCIFVLLVRILIARQIKTKVE